MNVKFQKEELFLLYVGKIKNHGLQPQIFKKYVKVINIIKAAANYNELSKLNSLNVEPYENHYSLRVNLKYRIEFNFIKPNTIEIIKFSNHYA